MDTQTLFEQDKKKDLLRFVTAGSVDDGKSTLIGRLLYESKGIYEDQLEAVKRVSASQGSSDDGIDLALVTDGLKAEREQGITIDVAYRFFSTPKRKFIIADSPGHEQYTRNMATGASTADLAIILVDAEHGVLTQTKRHTFITSLLGIPHIVVTVNKMDLVGYCEEVFEKIKQDYIAFAAKLEVKDVTFIPISALKGDNVVELSDRISWYRGTTLLNHLETVHIASDRNLIDLRFPMQYVLRPDRTFRGYLGTLTSGTIKPGDEVAVIPSGQRTRVNTVFGPGGEALEEGFAPLSIGVTVTDEIDISRGDMLVHVHNQPQVERTFEAMVVWMHPDPMETGQEYLIKHTTNNVLGQISSIQYRVDVNTLHRTQPDQLQLNEIGRCLLTLNRPLAFDAYQHNRGTGSFIIIDRVHHNTVGAGMILSRQPSDTLVDTSQATQQPRSANITRRASQISTEQRIQRLGGPVVTFWLTGLTGAGKTTLAYTLERRLFDMGRCGYVIDGENLRLGLNRDLGFSPRDRRENIRRAAELARTMNEAGLVAICALLSPAREDRELARDIIGPERFLEVYLSAPLDICRQRDTSGIYDKADSGQIRHFTGVTAGYEAPQYPDITLPTHEWDIKTCVETMLHRLAR